MAWPQLGILGLWLSAGAMLMGCGGSNILSNEQQWSATQKADFNVKEAAEQLSPQQSAGVDSYRYVLRSVRHDLTLSKNPKLSKRCTCLDMAVGRPSSSSFRWAGEVPVISPDDMAFALRTEGSECSAQSGSTRRPSIQAVDRVRADVVVVVEELPKGRPQALGAVIPRPAVGGALYVRARRAKNKLPYARHANSGGKCRVLQRSAEGPAE